MFNLVLTLLSNLVLPFLPVLWTFIKTHWKAILFDLFVVAFGFSLFEWHNASKALKTEKVAHQADINAFKNVQATADKAAKDLKTKLETEGKAKSDEADKNYSTLLTQYRASLLRYSTNQSNSGQSDNSQFSTTTGGNGPSQSTDLPPTITITTPDAQICAENTARLKSVHDWAVDLPGQQ